VSPRLATALREADVIFAEDTRRTGTLLTHVGANTPMRSFFAGNERARLRELEQVLAGGATVALVSDAGTPGVSDPGASAVALAARIGATVSAIAGPSAVTTAVSVSGFDGDRFVFEGCLPRKGRARTTVLDGVASEQRTCVIFSAPSRVDRDLADLVAACGEDREVVVTRELSKLHEEIWRGSLGDAAERFASDRARGEFVLVVAGAPAPTASLEEAHETAQHLMATGSSTSDAVREAASMHGVSRRELYDRVVSGRA
jgi:16S rRNA (cytidine1402-2'-O)-methyltransferase